VTWKVNLFLAAIWTCIPCGAADLAQINQPGWHRWTWGGSNCGDCPVAFVSYAKEMDSEPVQEFIQTLSEKKSELMSLYPNTNGQEYNLLAQLAIGILGQESKFFTSGWYAVKENLPWLVLLAKEVKSGGANVTASRGPTQIKFIPKLIAEQYGVTPSNLWISKNAAVATMGHLMESLAELKYYITTNAVKGVDQSNYADYLPYFYYGARSRVLDGTADPAHNKYVQLVKKYMAWAEVFEKDRTPGIDGAVADVPRATN
jgi:hypothetical protein